MRDCDAQEELRPPPEGHARQAQAPCAVSTVSEELQDLGLAEGSHQEGTRIHQGADGPADGHAQEPGQDQDNHHKAGRGPGTQGPATPVPGKCRQGEEHRQGGHQQHLPRPDRHPAATHDHSENSQRRKARK